MPRSAEVFQKVFAIPLNLNLQTKHHSLWLLQRETKKSGFEIRWEVSPLIGKAIDHTGSNKDKDVISIYLCNKCSRIK